MSRSVRLEFEYNNSAQAFCFSGHYRFGLHCALQNRAVASRIDVAPEYPFDLKDTVFCKSQRFHLPQTRLASSALRLANLQLQ